ncbi:hypothetical protein L345_16507 [Ophiophagus hannah]|uniref:Uncharacterized protein n=1 Tax=Ophiophagus hannah TaxID=8665 RepID=V8N6N7_OPHHA|nr:hypothetical protein L345_16507 [Ophiophagus hannah]
MINNTIQTSASVHFGEEQSSPGEGVLLPRTLKSAAWSPRVFRQLASSRGQCLRAPCWAPIKGWYERRSAEQLPLPDDSWEEGGRPSVFPGSEQQLADKEDDNKSTRDN